HDFCDWYLEFSKLELSKPVLYKVLTTSLTLLHPFMPFLTEEIAHRLPGVTDGESVSKWAFPTPESVLPQASRATAEADAEVVDLVISVIEAIRTVRGENRIPPAKEMSSKVFAANASRREYLKSWTSVIQRLARTVSLEVLEKPAAPKGMAHVVIAEGLEAFVPLEGLVDFAAEVQRLDKEIGKLKSAVESREKRLQDANFVARADPEVVE